MTVYLSLAQILVVTKYIILDNWDAVCASYHTLFALNLYFFLRF